ncbi:MAG: hydroxyacid dehydrogenase [Pseudomonadota bacterium]
MMKIAVFETEQWEREPFAHLEVEHEVEFQDEPLSVDNAGLYADAEVISPFIYSRLSGAALERLPRLRLIATRSTGFDHIDLDYCRGRGIVVSNVPVYGDNTVAEHVFGLLLTISHHLVDAVNRTRRGDFSPRGLRGFDLLGKTLGVVGTGRIGQYVMKIANGFGMHVVAFDVRLEEGLAAKLNFRYVSLDELLSISDVISLHVPANPQTHHMISSKEFARMKPGAVLINTARGDVVDVVALVEALAQGRLGAAGLDVLPEEPVIREEAELARAAFQRKEELETLLADHILPRFRNVVITPHTAFDTREAVGRILDTTVDNIASFARGRPRNVVAAGPGVA